MAVTEERHDPRCDGYRRLGIPVPEKDCTCLAISMKVRKDDAERARRINEARKFMGMR